MRCDRRLGFHPVRPRLLTFGAGKPQVGPSTAPLAPVDYLEVPEAREVSDVDRNENQAIGQRDRRDLPVDVGSRFSQGLTARASYL